MRKTITWISRILVGALFIFSGIIKANDPLGFAYKLEEYFTIFGMDFMKDLSVYLSIGACVLEVFVGALLLLGLWRRFTSTLLLLMILFFGFLTFYSAYYNVVNDCGCFGDFLKLTPWESFYKNLILFALILWIFFNKSYINPIFNPLQTKRIAFSILALAILFPVYTYNFLPVWDFRPYEVGNNIKELMTIPEDAPRPKYETRIIYKNKKTGEKKEFKTSNLPSDDSKWEWDTTINKLVQKGYTPPIHDFSIADFDGYDYTSDFLGQKAYRILVVQYDLDKSNTNAQDELNELAKNVKESDRVAFWALTASSQEEVNKYKKKYNVDYPFYVADATMLKTIIRANPGVLLLKGNVIKAKWSDLTIPDMKTVNSYIKEKKN